MEQAWHISLLGICALLGVAYCGTCPEESGSCQSFEAWVCWYKEWERTMNQWRLQIESKCSQEELGEEWKELFTCPTMACKNGSTDACEADLFNCTICRCNNEKFNKYERYFNRWKKQHLKYQKLQNIYIEKLKDCGKRTSCSSEPGNDITPADTDSSTEKPSAVPVTTGAATTTEPAFENSSMTTENGGIFLDVIFVIDGSSSIDAAEFSYVKQWVINRTLQIYNEYGSYAQVEVLQFSNKDPDRYNVPIGESKRFIIPFNLGDCVNNDSCVTERITNMALIGSQTFTHYALRRTMEVEFLQSRRYNESLKIIVLLTDGEANDASRLPTWYDQYQGVVTTFAVGVGDYHDFINELRTVANGNTGNDRVFILENFEQLAEEIDLMIGIKSLVRGEDLRTSKIDMMFILDGSGSVGVSNFELMKTWVKNISRYFDMENSTKIGVVQYSHYFEDRPKDEQKFIKTEIRLEYHANRTDFENKIDNMTLHNFTTYTAHAIDKTIDDFNSSDRFADLLTKKVMILLTDGQSSDPGKIPTSANYAHSLGIITYAVGVGAQVNKEELSIIANGNRSNNERVFHVSDFDGLAEIVESILHEVAINT